jgi:hypothetical protein
MSSIELHYTIEILKEMNVEESCRLSWANRKREFAGSKEFINMIEKKVLFDEDLLID